MKGTDVELHRTKGKVIDKTTGEVRVIQGVRETYEIRDTSDNQPSSECKLVVIGKSISKQLLIDSFAEKVKIDVDMIK